MIDDNVIEFWPEKLAQFIDTMIVRQPPKLGGGTRARIFVELCGECVFRNAARLQGENLCAVLDEHFIGAAEKLFLSEISGFSAGRVGLFRQNLCELADNHLA